MVAGCSESPVVFVCAQSWRFFSAGEARRLREPLRIRTPWLASKYGAENATTFARAAVIVDLLEREVVVLRGRREQPAERRPDEDDLREPELLRDRLRQAGSKPVGFLIVVPVTLPFQNPGAGTSKPTVRVPAVIVGADDRAAKAAAVVAAR